MTNTEKTNHFDAVVESTIATIRESLVIKGKEYRRDGNPYHNFEEASKETGLIREKSLDGMAIKHTISINDMTNDLAKGILPSREQVEEKFKDAINYLIIKKASILQRIEESENVPEELNKTLDEVKAESRVKKEMPSELLQFLKGIVAERQAEKEVEDKVYSKSAVVVESKEGIKIVEGKHLRMYAPSQLLTNLFACKDFSLMPDREIQEIVKGLATKKNHVKDIETAQRIFLEVQLPEEIKERLSPEMFLSDLTVIQEFFRKTGAETITFVYPELFEMKMHISDVE